MKKAALTFDLDLVDHLNGAEVDEMEEAFPLFKEFCIQNPAVKSTWFVRIDDQMEARFGAPDHIFKAHKDKISWLKENGHEIGWHFHSFRQSDGKWRQNTDEMDVAEELNSNFPLAVKYGLDILRMGWAYHSNVTMRIVNSFGLLADCSAMPRPNYSWEMSTRNWENTPNHPYFPSTADYRVPGNPCYSVLEFPMSMMQISAPYDTEQGVIRYLNPSYHSDIFRNAINKFDGEYCNLISHPYEFLPSDREHGMLAFDFSEFASNINYLCDIGYKCCTIGEMINDFLNT